MPLRPIDMQVMLPKIQSFKHAKETIVNKQANTLQQDQQTNIQESEQKLKQVNTYQQKEEERIKKEEKNAQSESQYQKKSKRQNKKNEENEPEDSVEKKSQGLGYHRFDMKV